MKADVIIGLQYGDEGKGKIVDLIAHNYDAIVRANGGNNAGHSIAIKDKSFAVHALPSGVLQKDKINIIGSGCVVNPIAIDQEIKKLGSDFIGKLFISDRAPLVLKQHIQEDKDQELLKGDKSIGTTLKGIGPAYCALKRRETILVGDLLDIDTALSKYSFDQSIKEELLEYKLLIEPYISNTIDLISRQNTVLIEGSQASMLDNLYGTFPYTTSSNTIVSGLLTGSALNHKQVNEVIGVIKAYSTRVGNGIFISEDLGEAGEKIRKIGKEIGVSTGRNRRCGWLDLVQLKYSISLNGVDKLAVMKSDVLDDFDEIKVCVAYKNIHSSEIITSYPFDLHNYLPVFKTFKGWKSKTFEETSYDKLPTLLKEYLSFIETELNTPIAFISTGPKREDTIIR